MAAALALVAAVALTAFTALTALTPVGARAQGALTIPPPRGMLSDFAGVISAERADQIERLAQFVRAKSGGEIAIVTLRDLGGREVGDVALQIGREWKVGSKAAIGDAKRNAGVVVLLAPKETSPDGRGYLSITTGNGTEGFLPDAVAGDIRREASALLAQQRQRDYGAALYLITARIAERFAGEFKFSLDSAGIQAPPRTRRARGEPSGEPSGGGGISPFSALIFFVVIVLLLSRGRHSGCMGFLLGQAIGQAMGGGGRWGGGGGFGGGGGGGGFGGFGGGGGFSGGGSSGSF